MPTHRIEKINELLKQQIAEIITRELSLKPAVFATISKIDTTKDLRYSKVFVGVFPESESDYVMKTLRRECGSIQSILHKRLHLKPLPKLRFCYDPTEKKADEVESILISLRNEQ